MVVKSIPLNKFGDPAGKRMKMFNLEGPDVRNEATYSVKHTIWKNDPKPYTNILTKSFVSSSESHCVYDMVKRLGPGNHANLGVAAGKTLGCMAWGLKYPKHQGKVYGVDLFNWEARSGYYKMDAVSQRLAEVMDYIELCQGTTFEWADRLQHLKFRSVFIDADHHYETCKLDFELWGALVEVGGEVAFHDTDKNTVARVVDEMDRQQWQQVNHIYRTKVFKKIRA
jgi:hypothetical protein